MLILAVLLPLSACAGKTAASGETADEKVFADYRKASVLAKAEFEFVFSKLEGLEIERTATMARSGESNRLVINITY